ncbi:hypothetical protein ACEZDB_20985 [Streptacidiphilus sp. N1-3]|uniref:Dolichyl-phosphate-mannose-protein mannosyltransferase n=1 Tax=Streptacidiphilus alkalitolerans TaxID=3342712 RepID=A0ABV6X4M3_9ACTN
MSAGSNGDGYREARSVPRAPSPAAPRPRPHRSTSNDYAALAVAAGDTEEDIDQAEEEAEDASGPASGPLWPLLPVLVAQAALSWRLIHSNTAFLDEGTYLYSGHQELANLIYGDKVATYETFFSGSPKLYPVLAAVADRLGGLAGARTLSLVFMLLATAALYLAARRIHGATAAFFATALFAALGPTQFLGGYSTYDAMALAALAWAGYFAVRFACGTGHGAMVAGSLLVSLAVWTKYASLLWVPIVVLIAALAGPGRSVLGRSRWNNGVRFAAGVAVAVLLPIPLAGKLYIHGFTQTTLLRNPGHDAPSYVAGEAAKWVGALLVVALVGVFASYLRGRRRGSGGTDFWLAAVLLLGGVLAPANQIRIHTWLSLQKHVDFGAWFACVVAGALLAWIAEWLHSTVRLPVLIAVALVTVLVAGPLGVEGERQATHMFGAWPDSSKLVAALKPYIHSGTDQYLAEDYDVPAYYLRRSSTWPQWHDLVGGGQYQDPKTGVKYTGTEGIEQGITAHKYAVIVLDYAQTRSIDEQVRPFIDKAGYRKLTTIRTSNSATSGSYTIWVAPEGP